MRVLAAASADPRPDGFVWTVPGELVAPSAVVCDAGFAGRCGCERSWAGVTSRKATTIAEIREQDITDQQYIDIIADYYTSACEWTHSDAVEEAWFLLALAGDYEPGTLLSVDISEDRTHRNFAALEPDNG